MRDRIPQRPYSATVRIAGFYLEGSEEPLHKILERLLPELLNGVTSNGVAILETKVKDSDLL